MLQSVENKTKTKQKDLENAINDNGKRPLEVCKLNYKITNGFYRYKEIQEYTWNEN